jgi:hypothetical protein
MVSFGSVRTAARKRMGIEREVVNPASVDTVLQDCEEDGGIRGAEEVL